jgi:tetratricopeptide (TPR) repeat protein
VKSGWLLLTVAGALAAQTPEATSLLGKPLVSATPIGGAKEVLENNLAKAQAAYDASPRDPEAIIWLGRRLAYLGRYRDAIEVFSKGIALDPNNPKFYRHRGHRYITVREFDKAIADFEKAARLVRGKPDEIEPDGIPNKRNQPRSTLQFNIHYHLGLARYLKGDFGGALKAYQDCLEVSRNNDDSLAATSDWLYMTYRRLGDKKSADQVLTAIHDKMDIVENDSYLKRLLMYKGQLSPESLLGPQGADDVSLATQGYGVGNWYLYNGDRAKARAIFEQVVAGKQWSAFGYIAAEAELARMR